MKYIHLAVVSMLLLFTISCNDDNNSNTNRVKNQDTALLIIDVQNDYFPRGNMELVGADAAGIKTKQLLEYFRAQGKPVIHIQHIATNEGATFFLPNTKGAEISHYVTPKSGEKIITKHFPNSFTETDLEKHLKAQGITKLIITGMMTDVCVDATTRAAFDLGFDNTIISDAAATRDRELLGETISAKDVHESFLAGLNALGGLYAKKRTTDEYIKK